jgi:ankyrin repeat protein
MDVKLLHGHFKFLTFFRNLKYQWKQIEQLFSEFGASVNEVNKFGMSALHHGTVAGSAEVVKILIQYGGNANQVIKDLLIIIRNNSWRSQMTS